MVLVSPLSEVAPKRALISRPLDFWLLGGASIVIYLVMLVLHHFRGLWGVGNHFTNIVATTATLQLVVNYPHFLASYHLAYTRGSGFIRRYWFQTVLVPLLLLVAIGWAYLLTTEGPGEAKTAAVVLGVLINFMYLTVGWHYTKQTFGVTMVYAGYDRYPLLPRQRDLIRYSLLALWLFSFACGSYDTADSTLWSLPYKQWQLPVWVAPASGCLLAALVLAVIVQVVVKNWKNQRPPSVTMVTPYVAMFVWFLPGIRQPEYFTYAVPLFHSIQYLVFVYRVEKYRNNLNAATREIRASAVAVGLVVAGWLAFEIVPGMLDSLLGQGMHFSFFLLAALVFINVHHYFLDNVLWRVRDDPMVREALMS